MTGASGAKFVVDTRPLGLVLLARASRLVGFLVIGLLFLAILRMPTPDGLSVEGQKALAVFVAGLALWVSQILPLAVTSLFVLSAIPLLGILDQDSAYSLFGNEAVFFIMGAFIIAAAVIKSGLSGRLALFFLKRFGRRSGGLLAGVLLVPAFLSFWMPEHAVAAMMFPITVEIAQSLNLRPGRSRFGKALFIAAAYGAVIGGVATFLGGARNPLAIGILRQSTGLAIGFFEWMVAVVPLVLVLLAVAYLFIRISFPAEIDSTDGALSVLSDKIERLGRPSIEEKLVGLIVVATVVAWAALGKSLGLANIAMVSVVVLFALNLVSWKDVEEYVNWGVILMYGGAIALGFAMERAGTALWMAESTILPLSGTPLLLLAALAVAAIVLTEGISNAAVVAILMPLGVSLAMSVGMDPRVMALAIAVPSGLAYVMPMSTPPNAIAHSSGFIRVGDTAKVGVAMGVLSLVVFLATAMLWWPLIGFGVK